MLYKRDYLFRTYRRREKEYKGNGNAGNGTEAVIQTGYASPFYLLAALGMCGVVLAAASVLEGKKGEKSSLQRM